jgi:hypothetical protein
MEGDSRCAHHICPPRTRRTDEIYRTADMMLDAKCYKLGMTHSIIIAMETINVLIEAQPITPVKIGTPSTRGSTPYTSRTGISESSRNSSHIVERTKKSTSNRNENMPQPNLLHFELEKVGSFQNQKGFSSDKAASVERALTKALASSVAGTARDLSFFKDVLDQANGINAVIGNTSETSNESARTSNSSDTSNLSLPQLVDLLGENSRNIIQRQQDEIRCLRLAVKELVCELLDEVERSPRHEEGFPNVIEFQSLSEEKEKTQSLALDRSPAVVSIRSASSHSQDIVLVPRGNYTQEYTEILSSKVSFEANLSFQNDGNEISEESADMGECVQLEIPDDATQPLDLSIISLSVDEGQMDHGKTERGAVAVQNTAEDHAEHEEEPSPTRGNYTQEYTEILSSKVSFEANLSFQNDGYEDSEESADMGECVQLEIPGDATQPLDLSIISLSVDGEQMDHGKTERGAVAIQNTAEDHAEHEEEPSPTRNTNNLSNCHQEQEGDQALHSFEAPSLPLAATVTETEEDDMGFTEMERSSLTHQTESAQQPCLLRVGREDSGETEKSYARPPSRHLEAKPTSKEFVREIVEVILQRVIGSGAMKESFAESYDMDDGMLSVGPGVAYPAACEAIEFPEELTINLSSSHLQHDFMTDDSDFLGTASLIPEELPTRELPNLNQIDEAIGELGLESGHDTDVPVSTCVGDAIDSDADDHSEHSAVLEQSSESVSPGSPDPAETIGRKDGDGEPSPPLRLSNETYEEIKEENIDPERNITNRTIGEEDTEAGHKEAAENTLASSSELISKVETSANVDVPAESVEGGSSSADASKQARPITSQRALDDDHESPVTTSSRESFGPDHTENIENSLVVYPHIRIRRNFPCDKGDAHPNKPHRPPTRRRPTDFLSAKVAFDHCMSLQTTMYIRESEPSFITVMPSSDPESWVVSSDPESWVVTGEKKDFYSI